MRRHFLKPTDWSDSILFE